MVEFQKKQYLLLKQYYLNNQGIGLVETLLAVVFSISLILALVTLTNFNIRNSVVVEKNQDAINASNRLVETLKAKKDTNFTSFKNLVSTYCITLYCSVDTSGNITSFPSPDLEQNYPTSYFKIENISESEIKVNIITNWKMGSKYFSSPLSTTFSNWRVRN